MKKILRNLMIATLGLVFFSGCQTTGSLSDAQKPKHSSTEKIALKTEEAKEVEEPKTVEASKKIEKAQHVEKVANILFDFKQWRIKPEYQEMLKNSLENIQDKENTKFLICGHTDERGSTQYNILLGQKRAYSAKRFLMSLGFVKENIKIKSYGKSKAIALGHTEDVWKQNRRVEITIK